MNIEDMTLEELRDALKAAETVIRKAEAEKADALREATPIIETFHIGPTPADSFDVLYDDTCVFYKISRRVENREAALAAGHWETMLAEGSMKYIFNTCTGKIVCPVGGGTFYIGSSHFDPDSHKIAMQEVNDFLVQYPEGGDITRIVKRHQDRIKKV